MATQNIIQGYVSSRDLIPALILTTISILSCKPSIQPVDYEMPESVQEREAFRSAPIVLVGSIDKDSIAGPVVTSHWDKTQLLQLHKITVTSVEYIRGDLSSPQVDLFYYKFAGSYDGPPPLGAWRSDSYPWATRRIFFVRRDRGVLRLACDGRNTCTIRVGSGLHTNLNAEKLRTQPLDASIADVLFTQGNVTAYQFAASLGYGVGYVDDKYAVPKLAKLVESPNFYIRKAACDCFRSALNPKYMQNDQEVKAICQKKDAE